MKNSQHIKIARTNSISNQIEFEYTCHATTLFQHIRPIWISVAEKWPHIVHLMDRKTHQTSISDDKKKRALCCARNWFKLKTVDFQCTRKRHIV